MSSDSLNSSAPWPNASITSLDKYRSESTRSQLIALFNTDKPVVWVTGSASNRVGRAVAKRFAMHGYRIVLHGNSSASQGKEVIEQWTHDGIECMLVTGPIQEEAVVKDWVHEIVGRFGRIDVLVHSAAIWDPIKLEDTKADDVMNQFSTNTLGSFLCAQHVGLQMVKQPTGGSIILTGDWAVARPYRDFAAYFAGKGCIPTLTRTMAVELALRNPQVRVNAVMPGPVMLPENTSEAKKAAILEQCLLKRHGSPDHIAQAALFLAEQEFITGVCLPVDGGRSIYAGFNSDAVAHANSPLKT